MSMTLDDHDVIVAFRSGDDAVFDAVVAEHRAELLRHAARRAPDAATAEDLVQETFVRAYRAFAELPDDSRIRPWLHQILRNVCIDDAHRRRREREKHERVAIDPLLGAAAPGPEQTLGLDRDAAALDTAMAALPTTHRDAFVQRVVDGLEYDEIAAHEGVSEPNARARVSRARAALRRALQGAAAIPITAYLLVRRPGRNALAVGPPDPSAATTGTSAAATANRIATTLAPAVDLATGTATGGSHAVPLLTKAAVGIGAVATMSLAAGPEAPVERPAAITVEAEAAPINPAPAPVTVAPSPTSAPIVQPPQGGVVMPVAAAQPLIATTAPSAPPVTEPAVTAAMAVETVPVATSAPATTVAPTSTTLAPVSTTTLPPTTSAPPTTAPPTVPPTVPPLAGGAIAGSVSTTPAGPRLDLSGSITLTVGGAGTSGSISGRLGVGEPDPAGSRRLDGSFTIAVDGGTIDLRLAGYGTSTEPAQPGVSPTTLTMSGVYRASGATGQLATSGSFNGSLQGSTLVLDLSA